MNNKIDQLEIRIAYQEEALESLSDSLAKQQEELIKLRQTVHAMKTLLNDLRPASVCAETDETPPPHY